MDSQNVFYATGKRKSAVAKVWIKPGTGEFVVNNKPMNDYFVQIGRASCRERVYTKV